MDINSLTNLNVNGYDNSMRMNSDHLMSSPVTSQENSLRPSTDLMHKEKYELSISEEAVVKAIERANKALAGEPTHVEYSIHKPHGDICVKVINSETNEVIREYPPEKLLDLLDKLQQINGTIIDEKR
jgi:flagellar protein FlaG